MCEEELIFQIKKTNLNGGKKMNKKFVTLAAGLLIGGTLLSTTAFANANTALGYETYKDALLNMRNVKSMTDTIKVSASDNGDSIMTAQITNKMDKDSQAMSSSIKIKTDDIEKENAVYRQDGKTITKEGDENVYNVIEFEKGQASFHERKPDEKMQEKGVQNLEKIVDALMGSKKDYFVLTNNSDGTKSINVKLSENQISPVVNTIASIIAQNREDAAFNKGQAHDDIDVELPILEKDIRVTKVDLTAVIDKNDMIINQKGTLTIAGKDASGKEHVIVINIDMSISNINNTIPDTVNLDGKEVKVITPSQFKHNN